MLQYQRARCKPLELFCCLQPVSLSFLYLPILLEPRKVSTCTAFLLFHQTVPVDCMVKI